MDKHIVKFNNHTQYEAFIASTDYIEPHVSICKTEGDIHYNATLISNRTENNLKVFDYNKNLLLEINGGGNSRIFIPKDGKLYINGQIVMVIDDEKEMIWSESEEWEGYTDTIYLYTEIPLSSKEILLHIPNPK